MLRGFSFLARRACAHWEFMIRRRGFSHLGCRPLWMPARGHDEEWTDAKRHHTQHGPGNRGNVGLKRCSKENRGRKLAYHLEGRLLEVCDCRVLCPCWIGEDPDNGTCDSVLAYHFDAGTIDGVDVTGRTIAMVSHIPGNVLNGNFRVALYLDEGTSDPQQEALLNVYGGKLGGPVAELAKLIGEVVSVERVPIRFDVNEGRGTLSIGQVSQAVLEPYKGPDGATTTLSNTIFSTVPGAPVYVGKATRYSSHHAELGHNIELAGHNALQSTFVFDG